jgi:hypothetical protein
MRVGTSRRRGAIVPLAALMMVFVIAMVGFAVDIGWIAVTRSELQNSADAAALAGAHPLMTGFVQYYAPGQTPAQQAAVLSTTLANARAKAKLYASYNTAGGKSSLTLLDSDIQFGYTDANGTYTAADPKSGLVTILVAFANATYFPNTVKVTMRRDSSANGALSLFFGNVLGTGSTNVIASAAATIYTGGLQTLDVGVHVLPMTYDVNDWNNFIATGLDPAGVANKDDNGNPQIQIYPYPSSPDKGNFGELSLDNSHTGSSVTNGWIDNGISSGDVAALKSANLIPLSQHDSTKWDWTGNPGFKSTNVQSVNSYGGQNFVLPLYKAYQVDPYSAGTGQGSNYYYQIVQFVGVTVVPGGDNRSIIVQPGPAVVSDTLLVNPTPAGPGNSTATIFGAPKLTQ